MHVLYFYRQGRLKESESLALLHSIQQFYILIYTIQRSSATTLVHPFTEASRTATTNFPPL